MANVIARFRPISRFRGVRHKRSMRPVVERIEDRLLLSADIFTVDSTSGGSVADPNNPDKGSLPYVVALANADANPDGSEIQFDPVLFSSSSPQTILLDGTLTLSGTSGPEVIDGPGAGVVSVSGQHACGVFDVDSGVTATISALTITAGSASRGAGILNDGDLTVTGCTISGNSALGGTTSQSGGGGALMSFGPATLTGCTISGNSAFDGGGLDDFDTTTLTDCTISDNASQNGGGGLFIDSGTTTLAGCTVSGNAAQFGGGLVNDYATVALTAGCTISGNTAQVGGGGLDNVRSSGTATLTGCTISGNTVQGGTTSQNGGGGLLSVGPATLTDCAVSGNSAFDGGGLDIFQATTLTGCTISGNASRNGGGGLFIDGTTAALADCTIGGNVAQFGGGLINDYGTATLTACTVSGNSAADGNGGGLDNARSSDTTTLTDTIVAGNTGDSGAASDISNAGAHIAATNNLIGIGGSGGITGGSNGNIVLTSLTDLGLGLLADNGGQTETMALQPGSAALHKGIAVSGVTTDQRGDPLDSPPDIGAFQANEPSPTTEPATSVTSTTATLNASVNPEGCETSAWFVYSSTDPTLASGTVTTSVQDIGEGTDSVPVSADLTGLAPDTTYYYAVVAANAGGTTDGTILSFTTAAAASPPVINTPLVAPSPSPVGGQTSTIDVSATAPAGDSLTWNLTGQPSWVTIASSGATTAVVTIKPPTSASGSYAFTLTATDTTTQEQSSPVAVNLSVSKPPPPSVTIEGPIQSPTGGQTSMIYVSASAPAGDSLNWSLSGQPSWATIASTGPTGAVITLQPPQNVGGPFNFNVYATDTATQETSAAMPASFTVNKPPIPPVIAPIQSVSVSSGQSVSVGVQVTDPIGDPVLFSLANAPSWITIDPNSGTITASPPISFGGSVSVTVLATDTVTPTLVGSQTFTANVQGVPPQVIGASVTTRTRKGARDITIDFSEPMDLGGASNAGHYTVLYSKTARGKVNKVLGGIVAQYDAANNSVILVLPKPEKHHILVTIGGVLAANGAEGTGTTIQVQ
jgi:hypothetical protein